MRIGYKKVKTLVFDPKKLFLKWASVELKSSLHLTPCHIYAAKASVQVLLHRFYLRNALFDEISHLY